MPNLTILGVSHSPFSLEMAKICPFMAKTWSSYGPSNWFFLNHNQWAPGCLRPNFTILDVSLSPLFLEMAKFQIPGFNIDRFFQLCDSLSYSVTQLLSGGVRCRAMHLARGQRPGAQLIMQTL